MNRFFILFLFVHLSVFGQQPAYYNTINIQIAGEELKYQLHTLITNTHLNELQYTPGVWNTLINADVNPDNDSQILLLYGWDDTDNNEFNDRTRGRWDTCHSSNCNGKWVREHVFPRSKGTPNLGFESPGSDAHHLHAIDYVRNGLRSNFSFIANNSPQITYSRVINQAGIDYFFPGEEWRGDVARMIMYMYVRYGTQCQPIRVGRSSITHAPLADMPDIFLQWNAQDPVSQHEINRNNAIYDAQGNRNPFIDNPYLATLIWNGPAAENKWNNLSDESTDEIKIQVYPTLATDYIYIDGISREQIPTYHYTIYDVSGKQLMSHTLSPSILIQNLSSGYYFIHIQNKYKTEVIRFMKK